MPAAGSCRPPSSGPCLLAKRREACRLRHGPQWRRSARKARTRRGTHRQRSRKSLQRWLPTSAAGLGARLLHLHRDWARAKSSPNRSAWYTWERRCALLATGWKRHERHGRAHDTTYNVSTWQYGAQHRPCARRAADRRRGQSFKARRLSSNSGPTAQRSSMRTVRRAAYNLPPTITPMRRAHATPHGANAHCATRGIQHAASTYSRWPPSVRRRTHGPQCGSHSHAHGVSEPRHTARLG